MAENSITRLSATETASLVRERRISAADVVTAYLERIDRLQPVLNAYITVCRETALAAAREIDNRSSRPDVRQQPLLGVPIALKDQFDTREAPTTCGSLALKDNLPEKDATVVAKLRAAGAIILGKLNMDELAAGGGEAPPFGQPRNPWNTAHSPGGSSSGSGIAVSAGLCGASLGEDSGGSGRIPASYCGIVGVRPSSGLVSRSGIRALSPSLDTASPMGRTVADCAALLQVIAGYDSRDALSSRRRVPQYLAGDTDGLSGLRIGVIQEFVETPSLDPEVGQAVDAAVDVLRSVGASCEMVSIPYIDKSMFALGIIVWCDGAALNRRLVEAKYQLLVPSTRIGLLAGQLLPAKAYLLARQAQTLIRSQVLEAFRHYDLLVCPTMPKTAPQIESAARAAAFPAKDEVVKRHADGNTGFAPLAGCPAISVPCGFTQSGMPIGLQIAGRPFEDAVVFRAARAFERNTEWHIRQPAV